MQYFHSTISAKVIGDGTVAELVNWLEHFISLVFPNNGIEWWSYNNEGRSAGLKGPEQVPDHTRVHHFACYVRQGNSEGHIIETVLAMRDGSFIKLSSAKNFGGASESREIAAAISSALDSIYFYHQVPEIVSMSQSVPRGHSWERVTSLSEPVFMVCKEGKITISTKSQILFIRDFNAAPAASQQFAVEAVRKDWNMVLTNLGATLIEEADLPVEAGV